MKAEEIVKKLIKNREDLAILVNTNPTNLPKNLINDIVNMVEVRCPYKACQLFILLNIIDKQSEFPESDLTIEGLTDLLKLKGNLFDELIEQCNSNTNLVILSTDNLNASKVAQIAIYQMLDTAN